MTDPRLPCAGPDLTGIAARAAQQLSAAVALPPVDDSDDSRPASAAAHVATARISATVASVPVAAEATPASPPHDTAETVAQGTGEVPVAVASGADYAAASASSTNVHMEAPVEQPPALKMKHSTAPVKAPTARSSRAASVVSGRTRTVTGRATKQPRTRVAGETRSFQRCSSFPCVLCQPQSHRSMGSSTAASRFRSAHVAYRAAVPADRMTAPQYVHCRPSKGAGRASSAGPGVGGGGGGDGCGVVAVRGAPAGGGGGPAPVPRFPARRQGARWHGATCHVPECVQL